MKDENPIGTLEDYSKPSHKDYMNNTELVVGNNMVPLRSDTICGPRDTQYCMEDPEQAFIKYASSRIDEREEDSDVMFIKTVPKDDNSHKEEPKAGEQEVKYFDIFLTRSELAYHKFLMKLHLFVDFMIIEDIKSIIDPRLSQVVLGKPFVEISNMTHDPPEGVVRFTNGNNEVAYKISHKIEQYDSLSNLERKHTKSVYLRNEEDKIRGVKYVMSKILGFYKKCLELRPEYLTGMDDEGEVT
nr:retrotransposon Orf1 [Tanacetum cinerariifolium]